MMQESKWVEQDIQLRLRNSNKTIKASVWNGFAVSRASLSEADPSFDDVWSLTNLVTGLCLGRFNASGHAMLAAQELSKMKIDWSSVGALQFASTRVKEQAQKIIEHYLGIDEHPKRAPAVLEELNSKH